MRRGLRGFRRDLGSWAAGSWAAGCWGTLWSEDGQERQLLFLDRAGSWAWLGLDRWRCFLLLWHRRWLQDSKNI